MNERLSPARRDVRWPALAMALAACLLAVQCSGGGKSGTTTPTSPSVPGPSTPPVTPPPAGPEIFVGAGDIAICGGPTWGRHKARTRPSPGNHDYATAQGAAYYQYFGANAGIPGVGYYSFDLGGWHIISLNSNVATDPASPQAAWLKADLAANASTKCSLAYWHHPLFSSGPNGNNDYMREMYRTLYTANVDLIMVGHDHMYERFAPQDADGRLDTAKGIRQFVIGTGGVPLYDFQPTKPNSEVRLKTLGVMKLTLSSDRYDWDFQAVSGPGDSGTQSCH